MSQYNTRQLESSTHGRVSTSSTSHLQPNPYLSFLLRANYESQGIQETLLRWSSNADHQDVVIHGESDFALLRNLKNVLFELQGEFTQGGSKVVFAGDRKDDFNKRLILVEN